MSQREPIAIVGVTALFPGSQDNAGFWQDIVAGRDLIGDVPPHYWLVADYYDPDPAAVDKTYGKRGAFLTPVPFDALEFGLPPAALPATDSAQLLALIGAKRVLADAADGRTNHVPRERVSVFLGVAATTATAMNMAGRLQRPAWVKGLRESGLPESVVQAACDRIATNFIPLQENTFPGILGNVVAGRIANRFDLGGSNFTLDAACASSLAALSVAINDLHLGNSDMVISGGVDALNDIQMFMCFSKTPALSPSGDCRPFSDQADGTMLGEGLSLFALRRLSDAERDGDHIYAVIRGVGSSSDGRAKSVYAPRSQGQAVALRRAYEAAGYAPDTVELMEAHGTGTPAGDAAEFESLRTVFEETGRSDRQWCALGSVKSQLGHTKGAAGAAGLFKVAMALHHKLLPPTIKVEKPNPKLDIENSPFYLNTETRPWIQNDAHPRRASLSSFGFGGTNFHVALEEYTGPAPRPAPLLPSPGELFLLAEADDQALIGECRRAPTRLKDALDWRRLARESQRAFDPGRHLRLALVANSEEDLRKKLEQAALLMEQGTEPVWHSSGIYLSRSSDAAPVAFLFSGQGSQYVGMGKDLAISFSWAREAWDLAEEALSPDGLSLRRLVFPKPAFSDAEREANTASLTRTENAQPALAAAGLAHLAIMDALGVQPQFVAGHSFGELSALHAAGIIDARALLRMARKRGELMAAAASKPGTMTAVSCAVDKLKALLQEWQSDVVIANHNSPSQAVLSGSVESIQKVEGRLSAASITYLRLPVSAAFHSPLIEDSIAPFAQFLDEVEFSSPKLAVLSNSDVEPYGTEPAEIRQKLGRHLGQPVRFAEQIDALYQGGVRCFVELGSGSVLTGLVEKCLHGREHVALSLERKGMNGILSLWHALGQLAVEKVGIDFAKLWPAFVPIGEAQPSAKSSSTFLIDGAGYGRPYPPPGGTAALPKPNPEVVVTQPVAAAVTSRPKVSPTRPEVVEQVEPARLEVPIRSDKDFDSRRAPFVGTNMLGAFQEIQAQITAAQKATQAAILESHSLTLKSLEALSREMSGQAGIQEPRTAPMVSSSLITPAPPEEQPMAGQRRTPGPAQVMVPPPVRTDVMWAAPARAQMPLAPPATAAGNEAQDVEQLLLQVVSEKTGYPIDVLSLDTELESGLGIDSIKRVEIFSAVQQRATSLPEVKPQDMASLRTLREIVAFLGKNTPPRKAAPAVEAQKGMAVPAGIAIDRLLLEVVSEKTGYPVDVLNLDTDLESGLGIDSIKRVEIFSAIQQRASDLPEVKPQDMASLRTLREVVAFLGRPIAGTGVGEAAPWIVAPRVAAPLPTAAIRQLLLEVVAEKTGYPVDVLNVDTDLESGLGIDSIKRVEIFSAIQQRASDLPEVKPQDMAALRTLGEIIAFLERRELSADSLGAPPIAPPSGPLAARASRPQSEATLIRQVVCEVEAPSVGLPLPGIFSCTHVAVTDDGTGVALTLVEELKRHGIPARVVDNVSSEADGVIFLGGLRAFVDVDAALSVHFEAFQTLKTVAARTDGPGIFVSVQSTGGDFGLSGCDDLRVWTSGLAGLTKTAAKEFPNASVKVIDIEQGGRPAQELGRLLAAELLTGGAQTEVGLHADGKRTVLSTSAAAGEEVPVASQVNSESVIVISGGGRGVTAACVIELAKEAHPKIALLGRTTLEEETQDTRQAADEAALKRILVQKSKSEGRTLDLAAISSSVANILAVREIKGTLAALREAGSDAIYLSADVQNASSVSAALESVRREFGPITGIVHGAGVLADKRIADKTEEQFRHVFDTKVQGLRALLSATASDPLNVICLFSSVAARYGNGGQCDYAAANEVLNKVAAVEAQRRSGTCLVKSINWGPWEGGMVSSGLAERFRAQGVGVIPLGLGARAFVEELCHSPNPSVEVVIAAPSEATAVVAPQEETKAGPPIEILVNAQTYPLLDGHRIKRDPAVPVVLVLEWFHRFADSWRPDLEVKGCSDLRVLRGAVLPRYDNGGHLLQIHSRPVPNGASPSLYCELRSRENTVHFSATMQMRPRQRVPVTVPAHDSVEPFTPTSHVLEFYGGALFHGPEFQVIHDVEKMDNEGAIATLAGTQRMAWGSGPWRTEAAALDGALQLIRLWGIQHVGSPSLPTRLGACFQYAPLPVEGLLRCVARCRAAGKLSTISDVTLSDANGRPVAELRDVEMHVVPEVQPGA